MTRRGPSLQEREGTTAKMQRIANEHSERMASAELQLGLALPKLQPAIEDVATMLTEMRKSKDRLKELEARMAESSDRVDKWQRRGASEGALVLQRIDAVQVAASSAYIDMRPVCTRVGMVRPKSATSRTAAELTHPPSVCASGPLYEPQTPFCVPSMPIAPCGCCGFGLAARAAAS